MTMYSCAQSTDRKKWSHQNRFLSFPRTMHMNKCIYNHPKFFALAALLLHAKQQFRFQAKRKRKCFAFFCCRKETTKFFVNNNFESFSKAKTTLLSFKRANNLNWNINKKVAAVEMIWHFCVECSSEMKWREEKSW